MRRKLFAAALFLILSLAAFGQEDSAQSGAFVGIGPEIKGNTRSGAAIGGSLLFGFDIDSRFAAGQKTAFFHDMDTVSALEFQGFFRYMLPWLHWPSSLSGPFLQAEAGAVVLFYESEAFPLFSGGFAAGWRFLFAQENNSGCNWYVEPAVRAGYPYIWGVGVTAGIRFKRQITVNNVEAVIEFKDEPIQISVDEPNDKVVPEPMSEQVDEIEDGQFIFDGDEYRIPDTFVYFPANSVGFMGLSPDLLENNTEAFEFIVQILNKNKNYKMMIEGHANSTVPEGPARASEESDLKNLSEERALMVIARLVLRGVEPDRLLYSGAGNSRPMARFGDNNNTWKNRRVEFILIKQNGGMNHEKIIGDEISD